MDRQEMAMQYLLGTLSEEERARLEEQAFFDDQKFEELEIAEDELIDRYVRNDLAPKDVQRFEKLLASPRIAERVEVARILAQQSGPVPDPQTSGKPAVVSKPRADPRKGGWWENLFGPTVAVSPALRPAFALSLMFMLLASVALVFVWMKWRADSQRFAAEQQQQQELERQIQQQRARYEELLAQSRQDKETQERLQAEYEQRMQELQQQLQQQQFRGTPASVIPLFLNPGSGTRSENGGGPETLRLRPETRSVALHLNVTRRDYPRYNALLRNIDSDEVVGQQSGLRPFRRGRQNYIRLQIDATKLTTGTYHVDVSGVTASNQSEDFADYIFQVISR